MKSTVCVIFLLCCTVLRAENTIVSWVHIGDLHITAENEQNYTDFQKLISETNQHLGDGINFAFLPGDNADDGSEPEYQLIQKALQSLKTPLYVVPGDHDAQSGSLALFQQYLSKSPYQASSI